MRSGLSDILSPCVLTPSVLNVIVTASPSVLFVADLLHPIDNFAIETFLNGNVGHCRMPANQTCSDSKPVTPATSRPHLDSTVAALAFNRLAQETFEKHDCAQGTHPERLW